ncbi:ubiquitin-like domain-containing protein [Cohnella faecalis]|nr:3D domain-containing protein [Cohnella faecalis]
MILIGAILSFAMITMFISLLQDASAKSVTIVDGSSSSVIQTLKDDVTGLLKEQNIVVGPFDSVSMPLTASLEQGSTVVIDRAVGITLQADGKEAATHTTADTVGEALAAMNVTVQADDRVIPSPEEQLQDGMKVTVVRVRSEVVETKHPIAYTVVNKKDDNLESGKQKVVTTGKEGVLVKKTERVFEDGKLVSERIVGNAVSQPAVQQVVAIGTKKKAKVVTLAYEDPKKDENRTLKLNGKTVKVRRLLNNVTLTAYSAGLESTGKSKGDSGYGITASGTTVSEGRTIAVDPKVIPMGWWVYIDGVGFRRAEDTGSAVKGKKIDVYYDNEKHANRFGTKKGYTVYVIGPVKPSAD